MEKKTTSKRSVNKKSNVTVASILRRPLVRLVLVVCVIVLAIVLIANMGGKKVSKKEQLVGYQRLVDATNNVYTYVNLDGKVKTYEGYTSMNDFYYDTTCVSRLNADNNMTEMALINKNKKAIVKFGTYNKIIQVVGGKYYKVEKDGLYGVIDYNGKVIIEPTYEYVSVTTVQEATEIVFECQKEGKYEFINEKGKIMMDTENPTHSISYANKFNDEYSTVIYISVEGAKRYFNLDTAEEVFQDLGDVNISYNIVKTDTAINFYDKNLKLKTTIDTSADYSAEARVYFKKYVLVEQRSNASGTREYNYTVYDADFNKVIESTSRISLVQDVNENVYFITNETEGVKVTNEKKKNVMIKGYQFNGNTYSSLQYLVLAPTEGSYTYDVYDFKGKKVLEGVTEYTQKGSGLIATRYEGSEEKRILLLGNAKQVELTEDDNVQANEYYMTIENGSKPGIKVATFDGSVTVDAEGSKNFYVEKYIGVLNGETMNIYDVETGKLTFSYQTSDYINRDETANYVELKDGFHTFSGNTILTKGE